MAIDPFMPDAGAHFGFAGAAGGAHLARSYMLEELQTLFAHVQEPDAPKRRYQAAVVDANCLGKQSGQTRKLTYKHLRELYALDPAVPIFQALRTFWDRDPDAQPLLALCCACARDSLLRASAPLVLGLPPGAAAGRTMIEEFIAATYPDRFSATTTASVARNLLATWTKSGHLAGKTDKVRARAAATPGAAAYALYLGSLLGARGQLLFENPYATLLDCPVGARYDLADMAARRAWLVMRRIGDVVEVSFPALITERNTGWFHA
jgi:hypothetical protein